MSKTKFEYSKTVYNKIQNVLETSKLQFNADSKNGAFNLSFKLNDSNDNVFQMVILAGDDFFITYSFLPVQIDQDHRTKVMEFITEVNYQMIFGNFEMKLSDGSIRYKMATDCSGGTINERFIQRAIMVSGQMIELYGKEIIKIVNDSALPAEAAKDAVNTAVNDEQN